MKNRIGTYFSEVKQSNKTILYEAIAHEQWHKARRYHNNVYQQVFNQYMSETDAHKKKYYAIELLLLFSQGYDIAGDLYSYNKEAQQAARKSTDEWNHEIYQEIFEDYLKEKNPESKKRLATQLTNVIELITGGKKL